MMSIRDQQYPPPSLKVLKQVVNHYVQEDVILPCEESDT